MKLEGPEGRDKYNIFISRVFMQVKLTFLLSAVKIIAEFTEQDWVKRQLINCFHDGFI